MTSISSAEVADFAPARAPAPPQSRVWIGLAIAVLVAFAGVPLVANDYWLNAILIPFLILSLAGLG
jgi:branched-chain amino acid transport system permease protein